MGNRSEDPSSQPLKEGKGEKPVDAIVDRVIQNEFIQNTLENNVLNFSQGLGSKVRGPVTEILTEFLQATVRLALANTVPEPDMSLSDWKKNFANAVAAIILNSNEYKDLVLVTKAEIKRKTPQITEPYVFADGPYYKMASEIFQVTNMTNYEIDPKYLRLSHGEYMEELKKDSEIAKKTGIKVETIKPIDEKELN